MQTDTCAHDIFARFPTPPCAELLGWTLLESDARRGWARFAFEGRREFLNPAGFVQGGLLSAMLDDTMGATVMIASEGTLFTTSIDMNVSFLAPAKPGRLFGEGQVVQLRKSIAFLEARLTAADGTLLARATSSAKLVPVERLAN